MGRQTITIRLQSYTYCRTKLGIVDYFSRHLTFEAPQPSNFDEQFVVRSIQNFFSACPKIEKLYNKEFNYVPSLVFNQEVPKSILCFKQYFQTKNSNNCINPLEGDRILANNFIHSEKRANYRYTPREGATNLCTNLNQSQLSKLLYRCKPREGVTNLCTESSQSQSSKQ